MEWDEDLSGEDFFERSEQGSRRGPYERINDGMLFSARDHLVSFFETHWPWIGYELGQATNVEQIRSAFSVVEVGHNDRDRIRWFIDSWNTPADGAEIQTSLIEHGRVVEELRAATNELQDRTEALMRVSAVLRQSLEEAQLKAIQNEQRIRTEALHAAEQKCAATSDKTRALDIKIREQQASFAQQELLRFILKRQYEFKPENLANATAGMPQLGWRQSMKRCSLRKVTNSGSIVYSEFKLIASVIQRHDSSSSLVEPIWRMLHRTQKRSNAHALSDLRKNWYYLRTAIEQLETNPPKIEALPFRVTARYEELRRSPSALDVLKAEEQQIK